MPQSDSSGALRAGVTEPVDVHFEDIDVTGVLHNSRYPLLLDHAFAAYWRRQGWHHDPARSAVPDFLQVVRALEITYHRPVTEPGRVVVRFWIERLGRTSYTYGFQLLSADESVLHADGTRVQVNLDPATFAPAPISERTLAAAKPLMRTAPAAGAGA
ncbi:acyl-CoA thioesterase [Streptomyces carminius]|uniref:acyl-CoA thioesterase n=1 Tax=Streptomyces carminius TaxID=2665496 RepID=UPI001E504324|nr:thioesterase family protein [Streptomyces carminius]